MAKKAGLWVQSIKCYNCGKTGRVLNDKDPTKEDKCIICNGSGFITSRGTISS